jgi:hypothetical protein
MGAMVVVSIRGAYALRRAAARRGRNTMESDEWGTRLDATRERRMIRIPQLRDVPHSTLQTHFLKPTQKGGVMQIALRTATLSLFGSLLLFASAPATSGPVQLQLTRGNATTIPTASSGGDAIDTGFELDPASAGDDADSGDGGDSLGGPASFTNRTIAHGHAGVNGGGKGGRAKSNPELATSFDGLNFHDQRFANNGNQFSVEPPDQGLCAGNGFVMESVNDVLAVYDGSGHLLRGPVDLNSFYGYPAAINRANGHYGPSITDPSCYYDADSQRWFQIVLTFDRVGTSSALAGPNHIDIAVSQTADPTGTWNVYHLPVQNNGTQGTPDHMCAGGFCLGDYPHIGADANIVAITTNEFAVFGPGFYGAQIYAISKHALATGLPSPNVVLWNGGDPSIPAPAFTVWPAVSPSSQYDGAHGGTEYFLSSDAVFFDSGTSTEIWQWAVSNTSAIDVAPTSLVLSVGMIPVQQYGVPLANITQKAGNTPLGDCVASPTCAPLVGVPAHNYARPRAMAVNDSRMQQVIYANGKLWGALDTDVLQGTTHASGISYFVLNPHSGNLFVNGTLSLPDASLSYPAVAVTKSGRGVVAFTVAGPNDYPSAGYAGMDAKIGAGDVHIAAAGAGPWDGFTGYPGFGSRPRWGDFGGAVADGDSIWIASEYIAQTCTFAQYQATPFGTCGGTRGSLGNWATRITRVVP